MKLNIFILEDNKERLNWFWEFFKKAPDHIEVTCKWEDNVEKAKATYEAHGPWDYVFLDHDLDQRVYVDSDEPNTGYQFAKWLVDQKMITPETFFYIHSMNTVGALKMKEILMDSNTTLFIPFNNFQANASW